MQTPKNLEQKLDIVQNLIHLIFKYPNERICQLLYNSMSLNSILDEDDDIFFIEDKALLESLIKRLD